MVRFAVALVMLISLLVPPASATLEVALDALPATPILPEIGSQAIHANLTIDCQTARLAAPPVVEGQMDIMVTFNASNSNVFVQGPAHVVLKTDGCNAPDASQARVAASYIVVTNRNAPGLHPIAVHLYAAGPRAKTVGTQDLYQDQDANVTFVVVSDYYPYVQAQASRTIVEIEPGVPATFTIAVANLGNAQTNVAFSLANPVPSPWKVTLPAPATLDSPLLSPSSTANVTVTVENPGKDGWNNNDTAFTLVLAPSATVDPSKTGKPVMVPLLVRLRGASGLAKASPEASPLVGLVLLASALAVLRRRA